MSLSVASGGVVVDDLVTLVKFVDLGVVACIGVGVA